MTKQAVKPAFEGKPLVVIPEVIPVANFLEGDYGKAFLEEYNGKVETDFGNADALRVLKYKCVGSLHLIPVKVITYNS